MMNHRNFSALWQCYCCEHNSGHAVSMPINNDQCRIKFVALTPMLINKYQCRSMKINWSALIIIEPHFGSITEFWSGIDRYWSTLIIETACPDNWGKSWKIANWQIWMKMGMTPFALHTSLPHILWQIIQIKQQCYVNSFKIESFHTINFPHNNLGTVHYLCGTGGIWTFPNQEWFSHSIICLTNCTFLGLGTLWIYWEYLNQNWYPEKMTSVRHIILNFWKWTTPVPTWKSAQPLLV